MKLRAFIALAFIYILGAATALAQEQARITGLITDEEGSPLEIVNVHVEKQLVGTVSDLRGHYSLTVASRDSVVIVYSMLGYQTRKRLLRNPRGNITLNVTLPNSNYELGEVTITESRRRPAPPPNST